MRLKTNFLKKLDSYLKIFYNILTFRVAHQNDVEVVFQRLGSPSLCFL